jgi:deoxyxylulose-5-phosphate synthase
MRTEVLLFTKPDCEKCEYVKERIPANLDIKVIDMTTTDGMAHAAYHEVLEKYTPILVVGEEIVEGAIKIKNRMREMAEEGK